MNLESSSLEDHWGPQFPATIQRQALTWPPCFKTFEKMGGDTRRPVRFSAALVGGGGSRGPARLSWPEIALSRAAAGEEDGLPRFAVADKRRIGRERERERDLAAVVGGWAPPRLPLGFSGRLRGPTIMREPVGISP